MPIKGALLVLIVVALAIQISTTVQRTCTPIGFREFEALLQFKNPWDSGLLWMYALHTPPRPKKLSCADIQLRTRSLIVALLIIAGIESHPGEFI